MASDSMEFTESCSSFEILWGRLWQRLSPRSLPIVFKSPWSSNCLNNNNSKREKLGKNTIHSRFYPFITRMPFANTWMRKKRCLSEYALNFWVSCRLTRQQLFKPTRLDNWFDRWIFCPQWWVVLFSYINS